LTKARDVHQLVDELAQVGIPEDQVFIESVQAMTTSGLLSKSSSARYSLRVSLSQPGATGRCAPRHHRSEERRRDGSAPRIA
jgi:hypothetical protein